MFPTSNTDVGGALIKSFNLNPQFKVFVFQQLILASSSCVSLQQHSGIFTFFCIITVIAEPEEDREEMAELSGAPTAKQPCQCCCQTYSEILSFLEKRSEAEQRLREEELALRREELEIQRSMMLLERRRTL